MSSRKKIAVIGAGPAGLIAAEKLAGAGMAVTIYDRMPSPARKFLIAGRGGLNLTHSEPLDLFMTRYGEASSWLSPLIHAFPPDALRVWCESLGEETFVGSSGRVFPRRMKAVQLLRAWLQRLETLGVEYRPRHRWVGWQGETLRFLGATGEEMRVEADATVLALGGASWPRLGSDGTWVDILAAADVELAPLRPSNMGFTVEWSEHFRQRFAGTPLKPVRVMYGEHSRQGEAMITAQGIEGTAIYALSSVLREAVEQRGSAVVQLDLRPAMTQEALAKKLAAPRGSKSLSTFLRSAGFSPLASALLREHAPPAATPDALAAQLKALPVTLTGVAGMTRAISSAGGVTRQAMNPDLMLRTRPGVFVAGEMLDWEAPTGGYLLQACFSTGIAAAEGIIQYLDGV